MFKKAICFLSFLLTVFSAQKSFAQQYGIANIEVPVNSSEHPNVSGEVFPFCCCQGPGKNTLPVWVISNAKCLAEVPDLYNPEGQQPLKADTNLVTLLDSYTVTNTCTAQSHVYISNLASIPWIANTLYDLYVRHNYHKTDNTMVTAKFLTMPELASNLQANLTYNTDKCSF